MTGAEVALLASALGPYLANILGFGGGGNNNNAPTTATNDPNIRRMLELQRGRVEGSEDLYKSVMAMAMGMLPTQYQRSGGSVASSINLPSGYTHGFSDGSGGMGGGEVMSDGRTATGDSDFLQRLI